MTARERLDAARDQVRIAAQGGEDLRLAESRLGGLGLGNEVVQGGFGQRTPDAARYGTKDEIEQQKASKSPEDGNQYPAIDQQQRLYHWFVLPAPPRRVEKFPAHAIS